MFTFAFSVFKKPIRFVWPINIQRTKFLLHNKSEFRSLASTNRYTVLVLAEMLAYDWMCLEGINPA